MRHCFSKCKFVVKCRREAVLEDIRIELLQKNSATEVILAILSLCEELCLRVVMLLYSWWEARNKANVGEGLCSLGQVLHRASMLMMKSRPKEEANKSSRIPET